MKKQLLISISLGLITISCSSQNIPSDKVPSIVLNAFKAKFPVTNDVDWEKHKNLYEAELDINDSTEVTVLIDEAGKLVMQKQDIPVSELSSGIMAVLQNQYKEHRIDDVEKIEKDGVIYYQVELNVKGKRDLNLVFSADGREEKSISFWD